MIYFSSFLLRYFSLQYFYLENLPLTYHKLFVCLFVFRSELSWFLKLAFVRGAFLSFFFSSTVLITFVTFLTYVLTDHILTAQKVFTCLSLFNSIRIVMTLFFPIAITFLNEGRVSIERIQVS